MISFLKGILVEKQPTRAEVDVNGIGFEVQITLPCYESLTDVGKEVKLITYLHVREDQMQLFGFSTIEERELFLQLLSIPGIGPKKAQAILSSVSVDLFRRYISEDDLIGLTSLSGIGKKTAQRLLIDLKDKIAISRKKEDMAAQGAVAFDLHHKISEAEAALESLGFSRAKSRLAIEKVLVEHGNDVDLEVLIKEALRLL